MTDAGYYRRSEQYDGKKAIEFGVTFYSSELEQSTKEDAEFVQVPYTSWGDYIGSTVERSNCRAIWEDYKDILVKGEFGWGSEVLLIPLTERDDELAERYEALDDVVDALEDKFIYDSDDWSFLQDELTRQAIDDYLLADLAKVFPGRDEDTLREIVYKYLEDHSAECEDAAGSVVFPGIETYVNEQLHPGIV